MRHTQRMDLSTVSSRDLLTTYAQILTHLANRGVTRSRNAPVGDVAEYLVTYDVLEALEVLHEAIRSLAAPVPHVGASAMRVHTKSPLSATVGAVDVTHRTGWRPSTQVAGLSARRHQFARAVPGAGP